MRSNKDFQRVSTTGEASAFSKNRLARAIQWSSRMAVAGAVGMVAANPAFSQEGDPSVQLEEIVVSGQRLSIESAQDIKRNADAVVDSIVAEDIGKLPDRSISEALQRISGVAVSRFDNPSDPEHFAGEGAGVSIRGLPQVRGELNGRDIFSASGGRGLSFDDVPAELMAGVDVYKTPTADMVEGGLGGIVNLRTRMPFDADGQVFSVTAKGNYGDIIEEFNTEFSGLYSNRWDTDLGEFGLLLDLSTSDISSRSDNILIRAFHPRVPGETGEMAEIDPNRTVYVPRGADWRRNDYERSRDGQYLALQWAPNEDSEWYLTVFRSEAERNWLEHAFFIDAGGGFDRYLPVPGADDWQYDENNALTSGTITTAQGNGVPFGTSTRYSVNQSETTDFSTGFSWHLTDRLVIEGDIQHVSSTAESEDYTLGLVAFPEAIRVRGLDTTDGTPSIDIMPAGYLADHENFSYGQMMSIPSNNEAEATSLTFDVEYEFDDSVIKSVKAGARYSDKSADNREANHWSARYQPWMVTGEGGWNGIESTDGLGKIEDPQYLTHYSFDNFQRGDTAVPTSGMLIDPRWLNDFQDITDRIVEATPEASAADGSQPDFDMLDLNSPDNVNTQDETTEAIYVRADFAFEEWAMPLSGNVGVRAVRTENTSTGQLTFPTFSVPTGEVDGDGNPITTQPFFQPDQVYSGSNSFTNVLPSMNLRLSATDELVFRLSASRGLWRPEFYRTKALLGLSASWDEGVEQPDSIEDFDESMVNFSLESNGTNPVLEPMEADQLDLTAEWYFNENGGMVYTALFYKDVKDFFRESTVTLENFEGFSDVTSVRTVNTGTADVTGIEVGGTKFFDELPEPWNGLGVQANYTYIDSSAEVPLDTQPIDTDGSEYSGLPLEGISEHTYNLVLMYENFGFSSRLAWNWRSEEMLSIGPNGWNGSNANIDWRLPVFADEYGQLDFTLGYEVSENIYLNFEAYNISQSETRGIVRQNGAGDHTAFVNAQDTRYSVSIRATF